MTKTRTLTLIAIIASLFIPLNNQAQEPSTNEIVQQIQKSLGQSPKLAKKMIGVCPNCGGEMSYSPTQLGPDRKIIREAGYKCTNCSYYKSKRHTCETFTPQEYNRGIRKCILVERIPIDGNPNNEKIVITNHCITFNTFRCIIINGNEVIRHITLMPGESFSENLPRTCYIQVKRIPTQNRHPHLK